MFIHFEKDRPLEVTEKEARMQVECLDKIMGERIVLEPDLLALSIGIRRLSRQTGRTDGWIAPFK